MTNSLLPQPIHPIAPPSADELSALRRMTLHCAHNFPTYQRIFQDAGITHRDIESGDPLEILTNLPIIGVDELHRISMESISAIDTIIDTETSSGTTGGGKIRFISYEDDATEHEFLAQLLRTCGIGPDDRVACLDTDPAAVMISFPRACELVPPPSPTASVPEPDSRDRCGCSAD